MVTLTLGEIHHLSPHERLNLIERLWDSLTDADVPVPDTQRLELQSRLDSFDQDRGLGVSWEELKAELAARAP